MTADWAANWFNKAASEDRHVVMDARCGLPGDFDSPDYATFGAIQRRKWESNLGYGSSFYHQDVLTNPLFQNGPLLVRLQPRDPHERVHERFNHRP